MEPSPKYFRSRPSHAGRTVLSLLYNIVDRIYIARIPDVGTTALGAVGLCFPIIVIITAFSNLFGSGGAPCFSQSAAAAEIPKSRSDHEYLIYHAVRRRSGADGSRPAVCSANSCCSAPRMPPCHTPILTDDLSARHAAVHDCHRYEPLYQRAGVLRRRHALGCHRCRDQFSLRSAFYFLSFIWESPVPHLPPFSPRRCPRSM